VIQQDAYLAKLTDKNLAETVFVKMVILMMEQ
jgi:hypothetical protein